jgi:hypothetical protein
MKKLVLPIEDIILMYNQGLSCSKIATTFNCSESFINKKIAEQNITKRPGGSYRRSYNQNFFNSIDTEGKAYWLGFLYADVCVQEKLTGQKVISLAVKDKEVIDKFIKSLDGDFITKTYNEVHVIHLTSKTMFNDLVHHGCIPRKSLVLKFPNLPHNLVNHFMRGYFDGDGSVFILHPKNYNKTNTIYKNIGIGICGTKEFLSEYNKYLDCSKVKKDKRKEGNVWYLSISGTNKVKAFYEFIYKDATLYLTRKKDKFENYFKERGSTTIISHPNKDEGIV